MNFQTHSTVDHSHRTAFTPLKPKRRCKFEEAPDEEPSPEPVHEPVLINAQLEFRRHRDRIPRSGRVNVHWRRVTCPTELSELLPNRSRNPLLARVIDKVKAPRIRTSSHQGIWSLLRCWSLALR